MDKKSSDNCSFLDKFIKTNYLLYQDMDFDSKDEKLLYINMHFFADRDGYLFPGTKLLAEMCLCSKSTIFKSLNGLESKGYIKIFRKSNRNSIYKIVRQDENKSSKKSKAKNNSFERLEEVKAEEELSDFSKKPVCSTESLNCSTDSGGLFQGHELYLNNLELINIPSESHIQVSDDKKNENKITQNLSIELTSIDDSFPDAEIVTAQMGGIDLADNKISDRESTPMYFQIDGEKSHVNSNAEGKTDSDMRGDIIGNSSTEEEIDIWDFRKRARELQQEERGNLFEEIADLISEGTGVDREYALQSLMVRSLTLEHMRLLRDKIRESNFLMGKLQKKPKLTHFSSNSQIFRIIGGVYQNREEVKSNLPCYEVFKKDESEEEKSYDPIY